MEKNTVLVFGHKNPDTDSICSAIAMARLKQLEGVDAKACALGPLPREAKYVLDTFGITPPEIIENVRTQVQDLRLDNVKSVRPDTSILDAYDNMEQNGVRTLPVCNSDNHLLGLLTMKDIAMNLIRGDIYALDTSTDNIITGLSGRNLTGYTRDVKGRILVIALDSRTLEQESTLDENCITIVGDRYETIKIAIEANVQLIVVTGNKDVPDDLLEEAKAKHIPIISVDMDTYTVSRKMTSCNRVSSIMISKGIVTFGQRDELSDVQDKMRTSRHTYYPVVSDTHVYLGLISRSHMLRPRRKKVILVDHNEYGQSAVGIEEARVLEIVDHHKIGAIKTNAPIHFKNVPVGSTCTILYTMFREHGHEIDRETAGLLISGIISDTLYMKSPTTTSQDIKAIKALMELLDIDAEAYAMEMFKEGSKLEGQTVDEILFKDFKSFEADGAHIGIGQVFTLDIEPILMMQNDFIEKMKLEHEKSQNEITLFLATDIIREGSYMLYCVNNEIVLKTAFEKEPVQGMFINWVVSRKKQVVPALMDALEQLKFQA
jgi:manganese-dependent inorganic pyrophosphatase